MHMDTVSFGVCTDACMSSSTPPFSSSKRTSQGGLCTHEGLFRAFFLFFSMTTSIVMKQPVKSQVSVAQM